MTIYIASSWKNQHAVEMLTALLREKGHVVLSFVENCDLEGSSGFVFEEWARTDEAVGCFQYDTTGAMRSDLVIYIGPSGVDAWAEVGAAYASGRPVIGLWAKGESSGLMRKMMDHWCADYREVLRWVEEYAHLSEKTVFAE